MARIKGLIVAALMLFAPLAAVASTADAAPEHEAIRAQIEAMKDARRGPFQRIRWFCDDGTVLAPKPYACVDHGGGHQHGDWSETTLRIRGAGYPIANVFAELGPEDVLGNAEAERLLRALILEQFLIAADDGWILRRARYYRGAFQIEDEIAGARAILEGLASAPRWHDAHYPLLVEAVRLLPAEEQSASAAAVRGLATAINEQDEGFVRLRTKIHNRPDGSDASAVRAYAKRDGLPELAERYRELADGIDALYALPDPVPQLRAASRFGLPADKYAAGADRLAAADGRRAALAVLCEMMADIRDDVALIESPGKRVAALRLLLDLEAQVFAGSQPVVAALEASAGASRADRIDLLADFAHALYGVGLLTGLERSEILARLTSLGTGRTDLDAYRAALSGLDRVPGWAGRRLAFFFEEIVADFEPVEPLAREYIPDRLRGSPLLHYGLVLRTLATDAALLSGAKSHLFERATATGLRSLNPGLGRGVLRTLSDLEKAAGDGSDSIVIVPQTIAELPPVAGIITAQEGNALSHVQLLARNLGIPNVVVGAELMPALLKNVGGYVELAASPGGVVELRAASREAVSEVPASRTVLDVDVAKLDLTTRHLIATSELSQADSGVRVGPKAAQLGELTRRFPGDVSPGLAIPFGMFRSLLDRPYGTSGISTFEWMKSNYATLDEINDPAERAARTREFLAELRRWIEDTELDPAVEAELRTSMEEHFGADGSFGVFVRSDTNIEDLPGFTGAGLNLTVHNVVGIDAVLEAVQRVWASPFTERAYGWRQALMTEPEHVYAAVLLHASVSADKSGVLITADIDTGSRDYLTVVMNEGVGGGVDGQSAEALLIGLTDGSVTLQNSATAPNKRVLLAAGGSALVAASGNERVLTDAEIDMLRELAGRLPGWFANLPEAERERAIADVEFGFKDGELVLFQIRPFVQSKRALGDPYLASLDEGLAKTANLSVDMRAAPIRDASP